MELVKTILTLQFATAFNPWLEMRNLMRVLGDNPSAEIGGTPIVMDLRPKGQRVILHFRALTLQQQGASSVDDSMAQALDLVTRVSDTSNLPSIHQIRYDSMFIEPYTLPFHELVVLMKDHYLRPSPVVEAATDIGLIFDQHEGDVIKHVQIGPMETAQLNSMFLIWQRVDLPERFVFASLGYEQNRETVFDTNYLREFLETAARWQTDQIKLVLGYLHKEGG